MERQLYEALMHRIYGLNPLNHFGKPTLQERLLLDEYLEKGEYQWQDHRKNTSTENTGCIPSASADATNVNPSPRKSE
jgi:hypothetical protein